MNDGDLFGRRRLCGRRCCCDCSRRRGLREALFELRLELVLGRVDVAHGGATLVAGNTSNITERQRECVVHGRLQQERVCPLPLPDCPGKQVDCVESKWSDWSSICSRWIQVHPRERPGVRKEGQSWPS